MKSKYTTLLVVALATILASCGNNNKGDLPNNGDYAPVISENKKTVEYGIYPQSHVNDATIISELEKLTTDSNGYCFYNNTYYTSVIASTYFATTEYKFADSTSIVSGTKYWFRCDKIVWDVVENKGNTYTLISKQLLDVKNFYNDYSDRTINNKIVHANNYEHSDIRSYLNNDFYKRAFGLNAYYIDEVIVDNSSKTTNIESNENVCSNTKDKVYLPSYKDAVSLTNKTAKVSDYAKAIGAWASSQSSYLDNGVYWTRSPSSNYSYSVWNVNSAGILSDYAVEDTSTCIRPVITISI